MVTDPHRVKEIFLEATEQPDEAAQALYLDRACGGDAALRDRVEALLRSHSPAGSFLGTPAAVIPDPLHDGTMAFDSSDLPAQLRSPEPNDAPDALPFLSPSTRPDSLGRLGHYEMLQVLGKGGFGIVFRAFDETLQRVVAVKVMAPQIAAASPARKRFLREARSSAQVRHDNVVQVYEVGEQPLPYLVMEFIPGETLQQRLDRVGPLDISETVRIARQIAEGLAAAHDHEFIHRDIKPGNILLESGPRGRVKITDFGLARAADDASISQSGIIVGTPMYMAPEQALGHKIDQRADLFSLGSVLYQMVSGRLPFRAPSTLAVLKRVAEEPPRPIPEINPDAPAWFCGIVAKLHAKDPADRFQSARAVADLLADCEAKLKAKQEPKNVLPGAARRGGRKWLAAAVVLILPVLVLAVTELAGLTHLLPRQAESDPLKPDGDALPVVIAKKETPPDVKVAGAGAGPKEPDRKKRSDERKTSRPETKPPVAALPREPSIHDTWIKALGILPLDKQGAALSAKMKENRPGFDEALLHAIAAMSADRQALMVEVWLKERRPAFAGFEEAWLKTMAVLPADTQTVLADLWLKECKPAFIGSEDAWLKTLPALPSEIQVVLLTVWLKERNPGFDGEAVTHKAEENVVASLEVPSRFVQDLSPLRALIGLKALTCRSTVGWDHKAESDAAILKSLKALQTVNGKPVAEFWKDALARQEDFKEWLKLIPSLDAKQQAAAVKARLQLHNPGSDHKVRWKIEEGVTEIVIVGSVADISPVRALVGLRSFSCDQRGGDRLLRDMFPLNGLKQLTSIAVSSTPLTDLSQLKGLNLTALAFFNTPVSDLTPLKDMKLTSLNCNQTRVTDLSPLQGMPLTVLYFSRTKVADLKALKGMPLTSLRFQETGVKDLTLLTGMPLTDLEFAGTALADLTPLTGMLLTRLSLWDTQVTDLSPLQGMHLEEIRLTPKNITKGLEVLRDMKSLKTIGLSKNQAWPAAEFWQRYEKGEFK